MMKVISLLAMTMALTSLTGCGLKGPLYFPPQDTPKQAAPTSAPTQKQKAEASKADVGGLVTGGSSSSSQMK